jgi:hypothetical protein
MADSSGEMTTQSTAGMVKPEQPSSQPHPHQRQFHVQLPAPILRSSSASPSRSGHHNAITSPGLGSGLHSGLTSGGLLSPVPGGGPPTQSILLNKSPSPSESRTTSPPPAHGASKTATSGVDTLNEQQHQQQQQHVSPTLAGDSTQTLTNQVGGGYFTPDPNNSATGSGLNSNRGTGGFSTPAGRDTSRSPGSPHCHFAPLPRVEGQDRPATRRNSSAAQQVTGSGVITGRSKPFTHHNSGKL